MYLLCTCFFLPQWCFVSRFCWDLTKEVSETERSRFSKDFWGRFVDEVILNFWWPFFVKTCDRLVSFKQKTTRFFFSKIVIQTNQDWRCCSCWFRGEVYADTICVQLPSRIPVTTGMTFDFQLVWGSRTQPTHLSRLHPPVDPWHKYCKSWNRMFMVGSAQRSGHFLRSFDLFGSSVQGSCESWLAMNDDAEMRLISTFGT